MNQQVFNKLRLAFFVEGCLHCRTWKDFIQRINGKLPIEKRIKIIDCTEFQKYNIISDPLIVLYNKHFDGFPCIFIGNLKISGSNSRIESETYLTALLEDEFIVSEYDDRKFNKECEFKKVAWKQRVVCK